MGWNIHGRNMNMDRVQGKKQRSKNKEIINNNRPVTVKREIWEPGESAEGTRTYRGGGVGGVEPRLSRPGSKG